MQQPNNVTFALYPYTKGFGYAILETPLTPIDYGVVRVRNQYHALSLLRRIEKLVDFYRPVVVLVQDYYYANKTTRAKKLIEGIVTIANHKNIKIYQYSRQQVKDVFETFGATNKFLIAGKIAEAIPSVAHRTPKPRKLWMMEDHNMPMFDAISLALTHNYLME
ncbi:MAG: crossover junction endodeoxyribonuclease RuvC [Sphingobacteriales bacterium JAD_PAG50586_3]|nr:MAG: crossover junction endodeoxyribonuclease RuvC [Sphingobacteriales bacterium JAD_PAG50586_3]